MSSQNITIDPKGRVLIPNSFREILGIKPGENLVAELDKENSRIILFPIEKKSKRMQIFLSDVPGVLSKAAAILARNKVDLVYSASRSLKRKKEAEWEIIADFSNTDLQKLQNELKKEPSIRKFKIGRIEQ